ncbi:hypothetical protein G4B88_012123, partial [Cannabis sativa]
MAGSTVHLFSIRINFSALWQPISALQPYKDGKVGLLAPKLFIALNLGGLALSVWNVILALKWCYTIRPEIDCMESVIALMQFMQSMQLQREEALVTM